jgi:hypothetical protein
MMILTLTLTVSRTLTLTMTLALALTLTLTDIDGELGSEDDGARDGVVSLDQLEDGRRDLARPRGR